VGSIKLKDVYTSGTNALALVSNGDIVVSGLLDASPSSLSSPAGVEVSIPPGSLGGHGNPSPLKNDCIGGDGVSAGGGAGRVAPGYPGDKGSAQGGKAGIAMISTPTGVPLVGGCAGGDMPASGLQPTAYGGLGGGAIQLVARGSIRL